ncbi:hypothetical protein Gotri_025374, partial [Gossypium trilobum]|nr:hypothetical protein [Gossypium trilobum]
MEYVLANLRLVDDEEETIQEDVAVVENFPQFCLVGRCLTDSVVHFPSLRNTMADLWHPIGGICITDIGEKQYLFQFFHEVNIAMVLVGTPWFFNNHLLILKRISYGDNPAVLELNSTEFWVQVHDLPPGLMSESMAVQLENINWEAMTAYARFKYEKLSLFYFICGKLGHGRLRIEPLKIVFGWDLSIRAVVRCRDTETSKWLRTTDGFQCSTESLQNAAGGKKNWRTWGEDGSVSIGLGKGSMDCALEVENDPIAIMKGKKRQRVVEGQIDYLGPKVGPGSMDILASSGEQSSRMKCGFANGIDIGAMGTRGGLSLGWNGNSLITLKSFSSFHIDVEVHDNEGGG